MLDEIKAWLKSLGYSGSGSVPIYPDDVRRLEEIAARCSAKDASPCRKCGGSGIVVTLTGIADCDGCTKERRP